MTVVRLHRHAPEAKNATSCAVCGTADMREVTDHVQVGTPGTPAQDAGVCNSCGRVLDNVVGKFGGELTVMVDEAQHDANERDITIPGAHPKKPASR
jgi:hypothetical protein